MPKPNIKIMLSGGGTGGHIFPAVAIANAIKKQYPMAEILFVGALGRMEMEKVPHEGYEIIGINIAGVQRRITYKNLLLPYKIISSIISCRTILKKFQPNIVIGTGGYASGPLLRTAANKGIPTVIQEQNSFPGLTNRMLAKKAKIICVAWEGTEKYFPAAKIRLTGNPVRSEIIDIKDKRTTASAFFGLNPNTPTLLAVGGSLGAKAINEGVKHNLELIKEKKWQLIWQTGNSYAEEAESALKQLNYPGAKTYPFIQKMDFAYAMSDIVISRAGAIAISELCCVGKPVILIPSPYVAEDHQTKNARKLTEKNAAIMISETEIATKLPRELSHLMENDTERNEMGEAIKALAITDAAERITKEVTKLLEND